MLDLVKFVNNGVEIDKYEDPYQSKGGWFHRRIVWGKKATSSKGKAMKLCKHINETLNHRLCKRMASTVICVIL